MKNFFLLIASLLCVACAVHKQVTPSESTRVEIRTQTVFQTDTVIIERPQIIDRVATLDTVSVLDNKYAHSEASVSAGVLMHSLEAKPIKEPVPVQTKTIVRDSLVYVDRYILDTKEVPAKLTAWQRFKMKIGGWAFGIILLAIVCTTIHFVLQFKSKLL